MDAQKFVKKFGLTFPAGLDPDLKIARAYQFVGMPLTVFISKEVEIAERVTGPLDETGLKQRIQKLVQERPAPSINCVGLAKEAQGLFKNATERNPKEGKHWRKEIDLANKRCKEGMEKQAVGIFNEVIHEMKRELQRK